MAAVVLFEIGQRLVEVVGVDVGEDLPQYLAVFELAQRRDSVGEVEGVDLDANVSYSTRTCSRRHVETYPVEERLEQLGLEVVQGGVSRGLVPACRSVNAVMRSE